VKRVRGARLFGRYVQLCLAACVLISGVDLVQVNFRNPGDPSSLDSALLHPGYGLFTFNF